MENLNRDILNYPREFRLREELDYGSLFPNINYGSINEDDREMNELSGMFTFNSGHIICFKIKLSNNYPEDKPVVIFNEDYKYNKYEDNEMSNYISQLLPFCNDKLEFNNDLVEWNNFIFLGEWLTEIKKLIWC